MSVEAVSWVLRGGHEQGAVKVPSNRRAGHQTVRLVLLVLAEHADPYGRGACPSQRTIAAEAGLSRQSVQPALELLIEHGLIVVAAKARPRVHGTVFDLAMNSAGVSPPSNPPLDDETWQGVPVRDVPNLDGDLDGGLDGVPLHKPEPELSISPRDSYRGDEHKLSLEEIRQLRASAIDEGRHQLADERSKLTMHEAS